MWRIGLISDTHGLLRPEAIAFLAGSDHIVHAGDIGDPAILERLAAIAPVSAVRGNNDSGAWALQLPQARTLRFADADIHVVHDIGDIAIDPFTTGVRVVVSGHSHAPKMRERDGVWFVNPGSAGRRRFRLPISLGELLIERTPQTTPAITPRLHEIVPAS